MIEQRLISDKLVNWIEKYINCAFGSIETGDSNPVAAVLERKNNGVLTLRGKHPSQKPRKMKSMK